jgi:short subunit dehydrogenase-like uncharacterized protein
VAAPAGHILIYGASGYTGRLAVEQALALGQRPILAGRDEGKLHALARRCGCEVRVAPVELGGALEHALRDVSVVLNAAGPFVRTAPAIADACLRTGTHYLDVAGEIDVFQALHARDAEARARGVMLMPGVGFVVAATDCLAVHVATRLGGVRSLSIGVSRPTLWSRGSVKTMLDLWGDEVEIRRDGVPMRVPAGGLVRYFDYGRGDRFSTALRWPDVFTAPLTTGASGVEVYGEVDAIDWWSVGVRRLYGTWLDRIRWNDWLKLQANWLSDGPSAAVRSAHDRVVVVEARDAGGRCARSRLRTPDPYTFTQQVALQVALRVQQGEHEPGFRTPAGTYGSGLVIGFNGMRAEDVAA